MTDQNIVGSVEIQARLGLSQLETDRQRLETRLRSIPHKEVEARLKLDQFELDRQKLQAKLRAITDQQAKTPVGLKLEQLEIDKQRVEAKLRSIPTKEVEVRLKTEQLERDRAALEAKLKSLPDASVNVGGGEGVASLTQRMGDYSSAVIDSTYRSAQFAEGLQIVSTNLRSAGDAVDRLTDFARNLYVEFDAAQGKVATLTDQSAAFAAMARQTSADLRYQASSTEILASSYDILSSGFTSVAGAQIIASNSVKAAVGGFSDAATTADALTSILNSYKLTAEDSTRVTDQMLQVQNLGKIVVGEYAQQIGKIAPVASLAGVKLEELNAAIATSTASGLRAESAFAGTRQAISAIIAPNEKAAALAAKLGIEFNAAALKSKGLTGVLADITAKGGATAENLVTLFGSVEAVAAIAPLAGQNFANYQKNLEGVANSAGVADRSFQTVANTLAGQMRSATNEANEALLQLGQGASNAILPFVQAGVKLLQLFNSLPDPIKQTMGAGLALTGVLLGTGAAITGLGATIGFMISLLAAAKTNWAILTGETIASTVATTANTAAEVANTAALGANSAAAATNAGATNAAAAAKGGLAAGAGRLIGVLGPLAIKIALIVAAIETWKSVMATFWGGEAGNFIEGLDRANKKMDELARKRPPTPGETLPQQPGATTGRGDRQDAFGRFDDNFANQFKALKDLDIPGFLSATSDQWADLFAVIRGGKGSTSELGEEWGFLTRKQQGNQEAQEALRNSQGRLNKLNDDAVKILREYQRTGKLNEDQFKATDETLSAYIETLKAANEKHGAAVPAIGGALSQLEGLQRQLRAAKESSNQYAGAIQQQTSATQQLTAAEEKEVSAKRLQQQAQEAMLLRIQRNTIAIEEQKRALEGQILAYQKASREIDAYQKQIDFRNKLSGFDNESASIANQSAKNKTDFELERVEDALKIQRELQDKQKAIADKQKEINQLDSKSKDYAQDKAKILAEVANLTAERYQIEAKLAEQTGSTQTTEVQILQRKFELERQAFEQKKQNLEIEIKGMRLAASLDQERNLLAAYRAVQEAKITELKAKQQSLDAANEARTKAMEEAEALEQVARTRKELRDARASEDTKDDDKAADAFDKAKQDLIRAQDAKRQAQNQQNLSGQLTADATAAIKDQELAVQRTLDINERQNLILEQRTRMMREQLEIEAQRLNLRQRMDVLSGGKPTDVLDLKRLLPNSKPLDPVIPKTQRPGADFDAQNRYYLDRLRQMAPQSSRPELSQVNIGQQVQQALQGQNNALGEIVQRVGSNVVEAIRSNPTVGTLNVSSPTPAKDAGTAVGSLAQQRLRNAGK